jgi:hypothetical protein
MIILLCPVHFTPPPFPSTHRVHTEWQWPISGVHSIMMEKSALTGEGGGCRPIPFHSITIMNKVAVYAPAERVDILHLFHLYPLCTLWFYLRLVKRNLSTKGYNDFNNLVLPGRWWWQNLILRHTYRKKFPFFQPFRLRLQSKFVKRAIWPPKCNIGIKKGRIWCWFRIRWKSCKNTRAKSINA